MTVLFIFLDGVGLGANDSSINPFLRSELPNISALLSGRKFILSSTPFESKPVSFFSLDASLGVSGIPQSATGQATLLTGQNIPSTIGYHYGPKPDKAITALLFNGGIFGELIKMGKTAALLNAYPAAYFQGIESGRRLFSAIPMAATQAGLRLFTHDDLIAGQAISADFTGQGWRDHQLLPEIPILAPLESGELLVRLAKQFDFAFFEYWLSDYAGHGQDMSAAVSLLENFDLILGGIIRSLQSDDLLLITSDHGNLEDLSTRRHTSNPVPLLLVGSKQNRQFFEEIKDISGVAPSICRVIHSQFALKL